MANDENLIKNRFTSDQSREKAARNGRKGGIASGVSKRRKKTLKELAQKIGDAEVENSELKNQLKAYGLEDEEINFNSAIVVSVARQAIKGNMQAVDKWESYVNETTEDEKLYELPARVLGKAFVDVNRNIQPNKTYVFKGGRGGLKSSYIAFKVVELIKNNPNLHACIVRKVGTTLKDSVYAQIKWSINELGLSEEFDYKVSPVEIIYKKTGQVIYFRGADDPIKLKSIKPPFGYIGILWKEEKDQLAGPAEERSINQSVLRGGNISYDFSSYNPPKSRSNWVNQELLIPNKNRIVHHSSYLEAPPEWLGTKFIEDAEWLKEVNPDAYDHEYGGMPNGDGGNVFENLELRNITDEEIANFANIYQGVDWGWYPDPFVFIRMCYERAQDTLYIFAENTNNKTRNDVNAQWIVDNNYDDYEVICDSAEKKSVNDFKDAGVPARPARKPPGSIESGMKWLQGRRKIVIDPRRCPRAAQEFKDYEYERDKDGNVISGYPDIDNHTIDATRYALERFCLVRGNSA